MILFKMLWTIDALALLAVINFLLVAIVDGKTSYRNIQPWLMTITAFAGVTIGSLWLKNHQYTMPAIALLLTMFGSLFFVWRYILKAMSEFYICLK